jgi:hypothetical protein
MIKILKEYKDNPCQKTAEKVYRYNQKHPMSVLMLSKEDQELLKQAIKDSGIYPVRMKVF